MSPTVSPPLAELTSREGRVALVTGAAQGFGRSCVERLSEAAAAVAAVDQQTGRLQRVVADLRSRGRSALAITADVADEADAERAVAETVEAFAGRVPDDHRVGLAGRDGAASRSAEKSCPGAGIQPPAARSGTLADRSSLAPVGALPPGSGGRQQ